MVDLCHGEAMTPPMTPREKVEPSLGDLLEQASEMMAKWTPEERAAHFEAQKKAIVAAEMAFGDEGTRIASPSTLASGSGDHDRLIERLLATKLQFNMGVRENPLTNPDGPDAVDVLLALLAENAALRGDLTETRVAADLLASSLRADLRQAERQRDELRKALERIADEAPYRSGYCQSDVEYGPALSADEMQAVARQALANQGAE